MESTGRWPNGLGAEREREGERERERERDSYMGYSFQLGTSGLLCAPSHRQDSTYYGLCYPSCGAVAGTSNSQRGVKIKMACTYTINSGNVIQGDCEKR